MLEPDNWRHQFRLAAGSWGEARLRAARRALVQCPHLPMAHFLAASVYVARDAAGQAEREVDAALAIVEAESRESARFSTVALHWFKGLLLFARGSTDEAMAAFDRELALEARGQIYARECAANTWYTIGACCSGVATMELPARRLARRSPAFPGIRWHTRALPLLDSRSARARPVGGV